MTEQVIFAAGPDHDWALAMARQWIRLQGLRPEDARLVKRDDQVIVTLRPGMSPALRAVSHEEV